MQITADNVQQVTDRINMIVQTNSTEEQSSENLQAVTDVLSNTVNLLGNISVSAEVMMLIIILNCVLQNVWQLPDLDNLVVLVWFTVQMSNSAIHHGLICLWSLFHGFVGSHRHYLHM